MEVSGQCFAILNSEVVAITNIVRPAITVIRGVGQFDCRDAHYRDIDQAGRPKQIQVANVKDLLDSESAGVGFPGNNIDGATGGIPAVQCALGSAQDFYTLKVCCFKRCSHRRAYIDSVHVKGDRRILCHLHVALPYSPNKQPYGCR